jgi:hypothetical protein
MKILRQRFWWSAKSHTTELSGSNSFCLTLFNVGTLIFWIVSLRFLAKEKQETFSDFLLYNAMVRWLIFSFFVGM